MINKTFIDKWFGFHNKKLKDYLIDVGWSKYWAEEVENLFLEKIAYEEKKQLLHVKKEYYFKFIKEKYLGCLNLGISFYNSSF